MGYVSRHDHALLDFRLYLPQEWVRDEHRRHACHVPPEVRYHTRHEQCLEMLDEWGEQVPHGWVTGDDELGRHTRFRHELRERGERYVLGVPCTTTMRDLEAPLPVYQGRGRRPKSPWQSVTQWRQGLEVEAWTYLTVRDGEKGPVEIELVKCRVQTRIERKRTGPAEWLVVTRRPLADAQAWEPRASRDATDQDARYRYQYYLTPTCVSEMELEEPSLAELARVIKAGACIEASFKRGKGEVGMDEYQVRTWVGIELRRARRESTFPQAPLRSRTVGFPEYGSDPGFPLTVFLNMRKLKRWLASTPLIPSLPSGSSEKAGSSDTCR
jgi:hypothetical protein